MARFNMRNQTFLASWLAEHNMSQRDLVTTLQALGDTATRPSIARRIARCAAGETEPSGEMRAFLTLLAHARAISETMAPAARKNRRKR